MSNNGTDRLAVGTHETVTGSPSTEKVGSDKRAKHLRLGAVNPAMHDRRLRIVALLRSRFADEKQIAVAASFGVSRTLTLRWLDAEMVDRNPAPLALLLSVDEEAFEQIVADLRADRAAMREGR
jgi:hypothetical protein